MTNFVTTKRALLTSVLSLVLCFAMLLGTTFAWFTDTVTSYDNIIQTGDLNVEMYWAQGEKDPDEASWLDASKTAIFNYDNWEPGYADAKHIKIKNTGTLAFDWMLRIVSSDTVSKLAEVIDVYYVEDAEEACTRAAISSYERLGTLRDVMNTKNNISNKVNGTLYSATKNTDKIPEGGKTETTFSLVLVMQEEAGDEYKKLSIGSDLRIEVFATQRSLEKDTFGSDYDTTVPSLEIPAAYVRPIEKDEVIYGVSTQTENKKVVDEGLNVVSEGSIIGKLTLDTAYQFLPTDEIDADNYYANWHADYVVYMDEEIAADSVALSGYYDLFGSAGHDWVTLAGKEGDTIAAKQEIRLLELLLGVNVNYKEISTFGNDGVGFLCGATNLSYENIGKTLTVELRIYETLDKPHDPHTRDDGTQCSGSSTNCETGRYITIGEFTYTFSEDIPVAIVEEKPEYTGEGKITWGEYGQWSPTEGLEANLEAAFTFTAPDDAKTVETSPYKDWICDYYVSLDQDLGANQIFLGGNYGSFGWIGFHNGNITPTAGEEIALLGGVTTSGWTYESIVKNVGTFICGVGDVDDALNGATFTVHLRLTNPDDATEFYNVNTVKYTFGENGKIVITDYYDTVEVN